MRQGPLHSIKEGSGTVADSFRSGSYMEIILKEPLKVYRVYGGTAGDLGRYWARTRPNGPLQATLDAALLPEWGNTAAKWIEVTIPAGTKIFEGSVAPQALKTAASKLEVGQLLGGGNQIYINEFIDRKVWQAVTGGFDDIR